MNFSQAPALYATLNSTIIGTTSGTMPTSTDYRRIAYGNGVFVAVAGNNVAWCVTSPDGINWTQCTLGSVAAWYDVTFNQGKFIIAGINAATTYTSTDGYTWSALVLPFAIRTICSTPTLFVGFANTSTAGAQTIITSPDGITWTKRASPVVGSWNASAAGNGAIVAVSTAAGTTKNLYSIDNGVTWATSTMTSGTWNTVDFGNGLFFAQAGTSTVYATSSDGINWTTRSGMVGQRTCYGPNGWVQALGNSVTTSKSFAVSQDLIIWQTYSTLSSTVAWRDVAYGNGIYVIMSSNGKSAVVNFQ